MPPEGAKVMDSHQDQVHYCSQLPMLVKEGNRFCNSEYIHMKTDRIEINIDHSEDELGPEDGEDGGNEEDYEGFS